jgi:hypothetical protein
VIWWPIANSTVTLTNGQIIFYQGLDRHAPSQFFRLRSP